MVPPPPAPPCSPIPEMPCSVSEAQRIEEEAQVQVQVVEVAMVDN